MPDTRMLTDRDEIRDWAAARAGAPALRPAAPSIASDEPVLRIEFGQHAYQDQDNGADRPPTQGGLELVSWDDWFRIFEERGLALVVAEERPGVIDQFHEIVAR